MALQVFTDPLSRKINAYHNDSINGVVGGIYIGSNESKKLITMVLLKSIVIPHSISEKKCHIGFSSWFNFDVMFQCRSDRGIFIDFNPGTKKFILETLKCIVSSSSRADFKNQINQFIKENYSSFSFNVSEEETTVDEGAILPDEEVEHEINRRGSWLNSNDGFNFIKSLASNGRIAVITEDIRSSAPLKKIGDLVRCNGFFVDTLYVSNIGAYMNSPSDQENFLTSVKSLANSETRIIISDLNLKQEVISYRELQNTNGFAQKYFPKSATSSKELDAFFNDFSKLDLHKTK